MCRLDPGWSDYVQLPANGNYGGWRRFDRAMDCYKDEDFACGVRIADEPLHGILCRNK